MNQVETRRRQRAGRTLRTIRPQKLCLKDRDRWILEALAKMLFLTSALLADLFFAGSRWSANKRMRRLFDNGLVNVWPRSIAEENVYSLSRAGRSALGDTSIHVPRGLEGHLVHLLGINATRITLALRLPEMHGTIAWWLSDWELRAHSKGRVVPDALFAVEWQGVPGERVYALEVDHHTKSGAAFVRKLLGYCAMRYSASGIFGHSPTVLVVAHASKWRDRYCARMAATPLDLGLWFTTLADLRATSTEAIWISPAGEILSLPNLPNRKDGSSDENVVSSASSARAVARILRPGEPMEIDYA